MVERVIEYQRVARSTRYTTIAVMLLSFWAVLDILGGTPLIFFGGLGTFVPDFDTGDIRPSAWPMLAVGVALCLWGLKVANFAGDIRRLRPSAAERALRALRVIEWVWIGGYFFVCDFAVRAISLWSASYLAWHVPFLVAFVLAHVAMVLTRKALRRAIAERDVIEAAGA